MKIQNIFINIKYKITRGTSRIPTTSKTEIFPTLVHGRKPLNNATISAIPDVVNVLEGPRFLGNIIIKTQISFKNMTEKIVVNVKITSSPFPSLL